MKIICDFVDINNEPVIRGQLLSCAPRENEFLGLQDVPVVYKVVTVTHICGADQSHKLLIVVVTVS